MDKKKIGSIALSFVIGLSAVPLCGVPVLAEGGTSNDGLTWTLTDGTLTISGSGDMEDYEAEEAPWYAYANSIYTIIIEPGVTSIGVNAFYECDQAAEVSIPEGVTSIGDCAFEFCSSLRTVTIPSSVTFIDCDAFLYCTSCTDVFLLAGPDISWIEYSDDFDEDNPPICHVSTGRLSEYESSNLIDANVTFVDDLNCGDNLIWTLNSYGVLTIKGTGAMYNYQNNNHAPWHSIRSRINLVNIESGVTSIGNLAFYEEDNLSTVTVADSVVSIGIYAFNNCTNLMRVRFPGGSSQLSTIGSYAFNSCTSLYDITLPDSVTTIDDGAFYSCLELTEINIPSSTTYVGLDAFYKCTGINNVYCYANPSNLVWDDDGCDDFQLPKYSRKTYCHVKSSDLSAFQAFEDDVNVTFIGDLDKQGKCGANLNWTLENNVLTISGSGDMYDFDSNSAPWKDFRGDITNIVIQYGATSIGEYAFYGCSSVTQISMPDEITSIGDHAFDSCSLITSFTIPAAVTFIGPDSFLGCTSCTEVYCNADPDSLTWTENGTPNDFAANSPVPCYVAGSKLSAFQTKFTDVNVVFDARIIASGYCGAEGENLKWVLDGDYILTIRGTGAMESFESGNSVPWNSYKSNIVEVNIENGATSIEKYAFANCGNLTSVTIPDSITSMEEYCFSGCRKLTAVTIPSAVTFIGESAFADSGITSVTLPSGVTNIATGTFENCFYLESVTLPESIVAINSRAFATCIKLETISIPGTVTRIENTAFYGCSGITDIYLYTNPVSLTWSPSDYDFKENKATICHVPGNYRAIYAGRFHSVNVTFTGDLPSIFEDGIGEHLEGYSLSLEGDIGVKFYMELASDIVADPDAKMVFTIPCDGTTETYEVYVNQQADTSIPYAQSVSMNGITYYIFKCNVSAKEMTSEITAQIVAGERQGTVYPYSVIEYANYILDNEDDYEDEVDLVKAMLVYGGYAQIYFNHNTDDLAYDYLELADVNAVQNVTAADLAKYAYDGQSTFGDISFTGVNIELKTKLVMNLYFKNVPENTVFKIGEQVLPVRTSGSTTIVTVDNITAKNISSSYAFTIFVGGSQVGSFDYSPLTYCYNVINRGVSSTRPQEMIDVVKALYLYSQQADSYIPN